jgi:serine/threonine protein kinase
MLKKGSSVNGYKILAQIGQGGMSRVWKVSQEKSGRVLALKEGRTDCMSGKETMERCFRGEEKILRRMNNVAIPALADSFRNEDVPVLVMDFIEGVPLDRKVKKIRSAGRRGDNRDRDSDLRDPFLSSPASEDHLQRSEAVEYHSWRGWESISCGFRQRGCYGKGTSPGER